MPILQGDGGIRERMYAAPSDTGTQGHTHVLTCVHIQVHTQSHVTHTCCYAHTFMHALAYANTLTHALTHTLTHIHAITYMVSHIHIHSHIHVCTHSHLHTLTSPCWHTHTKISAPLQSSPCLYSADLYHGFAGSCPGPVTQ